MKEDIVIRIALTSYGESVVEWDKRTEIFDYDYSLIESNHINDISGIIKCKCSPEDYNPNAAVARFSIDIPFDGINVELYTKKQRKKEGSE